MTEPKLVVPWPSTIRGDEVKSHKPAIADVGQMLAGKAAWLYEWATGASATPGTPPQCPRNPQGTYGHDHSGPPYGSAIRHPLYTRSAIWAGDTIWAVGSGTFERVASIRQGGTASSRTIKCEFFVRPFPVWIKDTPYSRGYVSVYLKEGKTLCTIKVSAWSDANPQQRETTLTNVLGSAATSPKQWDNLVYMDIVPGLNVGYVKFEMVSPTLTDPEILGISIAQIVNRKH